MKPAKASLHGAKRRFMLCGVPQSASCAEVTLHLPHFPAPPCQMKHCSAFAPQYEATPLRSVMKHSAFASYDARYEKMRVFPLVIDPVQ